MNRKPVYYFKVKTDTGLNEVALGSVITCKDFNSENMIFLYDNDTGVTSSTTIEDATTASNLVQVISEVADIDGGGY